MCEFVCVNIITDNISITDKARNNKYSSEELNQKYRIETVSNESNDTGLI